MSAKKRFKRTTYFRQSRNRIPTAPLERESRGKGVPLFRMSQVDIRTAAKFEG